MKCMAALAAVLSKDHSLIHVPVDQYRVRLLSNMKQQGRRKSVVNNV